MTEKTVQLLDISPLQHHLTCLPFGIYDWGHQLLQALHSEVARRHGDGPNRMMMANCLVSRFQLISQNRYGLANLHHKAPEDIQVYHLLSSVQEVDGKNVQFLYSDILVPLQDGKARFSQPPLCFILNEDLKTWKEIALSVEQLCEASAGADSGSDSAIAAPAVSSQKSQRKSKRAMSS
jgi:hypothetical protein